MIKIFLSGLITYENVTQNVKLMISSYSAVVGNTMVQQLTNRDRTVFTIKRT